MTTQQDEKMQKEFEKQPPLKKMMTKVMLETTEGVMLTLDEYNRLVSNQVGPAKEYDDVKKFRVMLEAFYTPAVCPAPYANETSEQVKERLNRLVSTDLVLYSEYDFLRRQLEAQRKVKWLHKDGQITRYKSSESDTPVPIQCVCASKQKPSAWMSADRKELLFFRPQGEWGDGYTPLYTSPIPAKHDAEMKQELSNVTLELDSMNVNYQGLSADHKLAKQQIRELTQQVKVMREALEFELKFHVSRNEKPFSSTIDAIALSISSTVEKDHE